MLAVLVALMVVGGPAIADSVGEDDRQASFPSDRAAEPHFRIGDPANLDAARAEEIYAALRTRMVDGYAVSGEPNAAAYVHWPRYNTAPYRSRLHGNRFVSNYANLKAAAYGRFESAGVLPVGSVIAKDSFAVEADGSVFVGALFLMEKMAPGFRAESGDWRYTMIMPDGSLYGRTNGENSRLVEFCVACHGAVGQTQDHLFFIPDEYRAQD